MRSLLAPTGGNVGLAPRRGVAGVVPRAVGLGPTPYTEQKDTLITPEDILGSQELDPLVTLFFGRRGDGKTLCMTVILMMMLKAYIQHGQRYSKRHPDGFKLATNYHVQFADFSNPMLVDMISNSEEMLKKSVCGIDEILSYVPSRRTMAKGNLNWANALVQIRKMDMEIVSTTQKPQNIDSQMLDQIDLFMLPILYNKRWRPVQEQWTHRKTGRMHLKPISACLLIWDWWGTFTGKQYSKRWPPQMSGEQPDFTLHLHNIDNLFSWYSTKERVPAMWGANRDDILSREWKDELDAMVGDLEPEIIESNSEKVIATLSDLINAQPDDVMVATLLDNAKLLDNNIHTVSQLADRMELSGFHIIKEGRWGFRALRLGDE